MERPHWLWSDETPEGHWTTTGLKQQRSLQTHPNKDQIQAHKDQDDLQVT